MYLNRVVTLFSGTTAPKVPTAGTNSQPPVHRHIQGATPCVCSHCSQSSFACQPTCTSARTSIPTYHTCMRQVLYTSNPNAPGGPVLRSAPGQAVFTGQQLRQTLQKPDIFLNEVGFKTLGLFPGTAVQEGRWRALDGNRYVVSAPILLTACSSAPIPPVWASLRAWPGTLKVVWSPVPWPYPGKESHRLTGKKVLPERLGVC